MNVKDDILITGLLLEMYVPVVVLHDGWLIDKINYLGLIIVHLSGMFL